MATTVSEASASPGRGGLTLQIDHRNGDGFHLCLDATIASDGVTAIFGPSGSGKTTLLDCVAGLRRDLAGASVRFGDELWQGPTRFQPPWRRRVAYVFQDARLLPHLSVVAYGERRAAPGGPARERIIGLLRLAELLERMPETLSAGQRQRVAIGRALLSNPRLLLLDEPLANLDRAAAQECLDLLQRVVGEIGLPAVYVSHRIEEVHAIADDVLLLENGRCAGQGTLIELAGRLDSRLANDEDAAAILPVETGDVDDRYGLCELRVAGQALWVSDSGVGGARRRLRIPARDVSVCRERPGATSILNVLATELTEAREVGAAHCLLRLRLGDHYLLARITRRSFDELALAPGDALYAQVKSTALLSEGAP